MLPIVTSPYLRVRSRPRWIGSVTKASIAAAVAVLACFPNLLVFLYGGDFLTIASEPTSYRYFFLSRLAAGDSSSLWLPQGYLTLLIQRTFALVLPSIYAPDDSLREHVNAFGNLTALVRWVVVAGAMYWMLHDRRLDVKEKAAVVFAYLGPTYLVRTIGVRYAIAPDYIALNLVLLPIGVYLFLRAFHADHVRSHWRQCAGAGLLIGAIGSNKISLIPFAALCVLPGLLRSCAPAKRCLASCVIVGLGATISFLTIHLLVYAPHVRTLTTVLTPWANFVANPGGEAAFADQLVRFLFDYEYAWIVAAFAVVFTIVLFSMYKCRARSPNFVIAIILIGAIAAVAAFSFSTVAMRPAGTTAFEVSSVLICLTAMMIALPQSGRVRSLLIAASYVWLAVATIQHHDLASMTTLLHDDWRKRADVIWEVHDSIHRARRPIVFVIPNNEYHTSSVEEALLKGFSDFPSWDIRGGARPLRALVPQGISFRTEQGGAPPSEPYPSEAIVAWVDRLDWRPLPEVYPALNRTIRRPGVRCRKWVTGAATAISVCG